MDRTKENSTNTAGRGSPLKNRFGLSSATSCSRPTIKINSNIDIASSFANLSMGEPISSKLPIKEKDNYRSVKQNPVTPTKNTGYQKKGVIKIPAKCMERFNIDHLSSNNYKELEAVIKDILITKKNKSQAKKSKAKTDVRLKNGPSDVPIEIPETKQINNLGSRGKDKPKSAQPKSYKCYYKEEPEDPLDSELQSLTPKSLEDLYEIYEDSMKKRAALQNGKKTVLKKTAKRIYTGTEPSKKMLTAVKQADLGSQKKA